jgi:hypothetical protein
VKIAIPAGVTIHHFGFHHAGSDHISGYFGIFGPFFFLSFACQANGLVVKYGKDSLVRGGQLGVASIAGNGTGQFLLLRVFHVPPL